MIDECDKIAEPLALSSLLLHEIRLGRRFRETPRQKLLRHAAITIRSLFDENISLKKSVELLTNKKSAV